MQIDRTSYIATNTTPRTEAIDLAVVHSTEGLMPGCAQWLTNPATNVSTDYIIDRSGIIYQLAPASVFTWHAGVSALPGSPERARFEAQRAAGQKIDPKPSVNGRSLGIELEHVKGGQPYTAAQKQALANLLTFLLALYPGMQILRHADVALPINRKKDPTDWSADDFRAFVASLSHPAPAAPIYTELSPLLGTGRAADERIIQLLLAKNTDPDAEYQEPAIREIVGAYVEICARVGLNHDLVIAQMIHETKWLQSFFAARPRRNPAGIGVTGDTRPGNWPQPQPAALWHFDPDEQRWRFGVAFASWSQHAIPAHVGRLVAWMFTDRDLVPFPNGGDPQLHQTQRALIGQGLAVRSLPSICRGTVMTLKDLGRDHNRSGFGWADPGTDYGQALARLAISLVGAP